MQYGIMAGEYLHNCFYSKKNSAGMVQLAEAILEIREKFYSTDFFFGREILRYVNIQVYFTAGRRDK